MVASFNGFVAEQREKPGECALTLVQFDKNEPYEVIHDAVPIRMVPDLAPEQYRPRGMTPLLDALGNLIEKADERLAGLDRDEDQIVGFSAKRQLALRPSRLVRDPPFTLAPSVFHRPYEVNQTCPAPLP